MFNTFLLVIGTYARVPGLQIMYFIPLLLLLIFSSSSSSEAETLEIHIDADYAISREAAEAIELGVSTALSEAGGPVAGYALKVVRADHRGNVKRSRRNMERFLKSDKAIAMIGGLHSPPYLTHRKFISENEILLLLPWSAAGPITRAEPGVRNWIFRLSVDDTRTGEFFMREAVDHGGCRNVGYLLVDTGWGRANNVTLDAALKKRGMSSAITAYFDAVIGMSAARSVAEDIARSGADCIVMLSNWDNGSTAVLALHDRVPGLRIFSHWGIMGGGFAGRVPHTVRTAHSLKVLQTCGLRRETAGNPVLTAALQASGKSVSKLSDIPAPTGFVHGYDLTRVLVAAMRQAAGTPEWAGDIREKRRAIHAALENLETPVEGILKTYSPPFAPYSEDARDAHEALGVEDLCMAAFTENGVLSDSRSGTGG